MLGWHDIYLLDTQYVDNVCFVMMDLLTVGV